MSRRNLLRFSMRFAQKLTAFNPWNFLWISIVLSEVLTALMDLLLTGGVTYDYLITGGIVSLIVAGIVIFVLKGMMQVRLDNEVLRAEVDRQRETTEGLSKALDFQSLLMEAIPDVLYVLDPVGMVIKWNRKAEEATGYTREEIVGKHALDFVAEEDRDEARAGLEEAYWKGTASRELQLLTRDGRKVIHRFSGAAIKDADDRFIGFIGIGRDISKLKKMEEEMGRAQKLESVRILAGGIAQDFNYLITSALENIHLAVMNVDHRDIMRGNLQKAQKAAVRAKELSRRLFAISPGGFPVKRPTQLGDVVREHADAALRGLNVAVDFKIAPDLCEADIDERQIGQVINAIVVNSAEAIQGAGAVRITAENVELSDGELLPLAGGRYARISVADQGMGIPRDIINKVFDPYFTTKQNGRGLGLTIAYAIIRNHDGHIRVECDSGKGTVFHIYLPASRSGRSAQMAGAEA